jgi:hypothetical protein
MTFTIEDPDMIESMPDEDEIIPDVSPLGGIEDAVSGDKIREINQQNPSYFTAEDAERLEQLKQDVAAEESKMLNRIGELRPVIQALASNPSVYTGHARDADKIVKLAEQIVEAFDRAMKES